MFEIEFYEDENGTSPVWRWVTEELSPTQRRALTAALEEILAVQGIVFFHAHGAKVILLLGGYDKARRPSPRHQQTEIEVARKRLGAWKRRRS